ncbi:MAG: BA14K family protein, partial [Mesorhizobium sp.]|uniref:BA14K family protein n=1 Tax=Mesorhizobium sp. TaxID=1871066 RepID=UPI0012226A9E
PEVSPPNASQTGQADAAEQPSEQAPAQQAQLPAAHLEWCAHRYRSYRPQENSYRSYSGEIRPCISPYFDPGGDRTASTDGRQPDQRWMNNQGEVTDDQAEVEG